VSRLAVRLRRSTAAASPTVAASTSGNPPSTSSAIASPASSDGVFGDPTTVAKYWRQRSLEDNCGLMSVADVVGQITGNQPTEQQMITLAQNTPSGTNPGPIYAPSSDPSHSGANGGVEMADLVVLLDHYGIKSLMAWTEGHPEQTGMPALQQDLTDNHKVIAWVNSAVIWNTSDQRTKADHYLVVTGIETNKDIVHLNDPGADHADEQVPTATFVKAWKTGEESIVVTGVTS
jgi:Peptidase_C39 like family